LKDAAGAQFGKAVSAAGLEFSYYGTDASMRMRSCGAENWTTWRSPLVQPTLNAQKQRVSFIGDSSGTCFEFDSITVIDRTYENVFPYAAAIGIAIGMTLLVIVRALRERRA
jgi:hypothetical protein